jgi:hypothetical protein
MYIPWRGSTSCCGLPSAQKLPQLDFFFGPSFRQAGHVCRQLSPAVATVGTQAKQSLTPLNLVWEPQPPPPKLHTLRNWLGV